MKIFNSRATWILLTSSAALFAACTSHDHGVAKNGDNTGRTPASALLSQRDGDFVVDGPFTFNVQGIRNAYNAPTFRFGTYQLIMPDGKPLMNPDGQKPHIVRDLHYRLYQNGSVRAGKHNELLPRHVVRRKEDYLGAGIRPIPVTDGAYKTLAEAPSSPTAANAQGKTINVRGSELMDKYLRSAYGYEGDDLQNGPIFALIAYIHPEMFRGTLSDAIGGGLRLEGGTTHLGAYIGNGTTRNSPVGYHNWHWENTGYPANVSVLSYRGAKTQKIFNTNALIALKILNELNNGPTFPSDYKFDYFRSISLKETLDFFHGWLDPDWIRPGDTVSFLKKLKSDNTYATYCAEHMTIVTNIALNVAQNEQGYKDIWGDEVGTALWQKAQSRWSERTFGNGTEGGYTMATLEGIPSGDANFTPLWKLKGIRTITQNGKNEGIMKNSKITKLGFSLAWPPETTLDLMRDFVEQYAHWSYVGPVMSTSVVVGFQALAGDRMGMSAADYMKLAMPVIVPMFQYHMAAQLAAVPEAGRSQAFEDITKKYSEGLKVALAPKQPGQADMSAQVIDPVVTALQAKKDWALKKAASYTQDKSVNARMQWARDEYKREITDAVDAARRAPIAVPIDQQSNKKYVQYYSPPAVVYRVINGIHEHENQFLRISTIATAMNPAELELLPEGTPNVKLDPTQSAD